MPTENGIVVLRKRFEFANVEDLEGFLADLSEYEEKKQVRSPSVFNFPLQFILSPSRWTVLSVCGLPNV
jgi:hypothetical protein